MNKKKEKILSVLLALALCLGLEPAFGQKQAKQNATLKKWTEAAFEIKTPGYTTFKTADVGHVFSGGKNSIVREEA